MLKTYSVMLECDEWIEVDAESEAEAIQRAKGSFYHGDLRATVMNVREFEE